MPGASQEKQTNCGDFAEWHQLLDSLCVRRGFDDNAELSRRLCALTKSSGEAAYEATLRNTGNWRRGQHLPNRRNFLALTELLGVGADPETKQLWDRLYAAAKASSRTEKEAEAPGNGTGAPSATNRVDYAPVWQNRRVALSAALGCAVGIVIGYILAQPSVEKLNNFANSPADQRQGYVAQAAPARIDMTGKRIYVREVVNIKVGEYAVVHGKRNELCGEQPPSWEMTLAELPELSRGIWYDAGIGLRSSRGCGGPTPARAIGYQAVRPGSETITIYQDRISITVE